MGRYSRVKGWSEYVFLCAATTLFFACGAPPRASSRLLVATTHTLEDSGILDTLAARFRADHPEQDLQLVVAGSGEVLTIGRRGDADALLTHAPDDERAFVAAGYGVARVPVMHNEFIIAGPAEDAAGVRSAADARDAFRRMSKAKLAFVSRADDSGTHKKERALWAAAGVQPDSQSYVEAGTGMAEALRLADQRRAYILTDIATFLTLRTQLRIEQLYGGDPQRTSDPLLTNSYSVIVVTRARNAEGAKVFAEWITSAAVQKLIAAFGTSRVGRPLFAPDAGAAPAVR